MNLLCFGLSDRTAPLALLRQVAFSSESLEQFLAALAREESVSEALAISTAGLTEFYLAGPDPGTAFETLLSHLAEAGKLTREEERKHTYRLDNQDAVRHLFRLAAGVDSDPASGLPRLEVLEHAQRLAIKAGASRNLMNLLASQAIKVGRQVREVKTRTRGLQAVAKAAGQLVERIFSDIRRCKLLLLGASPEGRVTARTLLYQGIYSITVCCRDEETAETTAVELEGRWIADGMLLETLPEADILILAGGEESRLLESSEVRKTLSRRGDRPLVILEPGKTRETAQALANIDSVFYYDFAHLQNAASKLIRESEEDDADTIAQTLIEEEVGRFLHWFYSHDIKVLVAELHRRAEEMRRMQLEKYGKKMTEEQRKDLIRMTDSMFQSILHDLTKNLNLQTNKGLEEFELVRRLFNISSLQGGAPPFGEGRLEHHDEKE